MGQLAVKRIHSRRLQISNTDTVGLRIIIFSREIDNRKPAKMSSLRRNGERAVVYKKCTSVVENGIGTGRPPHVSVGAAKPLKERLQGITNAMGWIKEELVS